MSDPTDAVRPLETATRRPPHPRWSRGIGALLLAAALSLGTITTASPANAAGPAYFCGNNTQPYVPVSEARGWAPGHAVTGKTVVSGTDPTGFTGQYIGSVSDFFAKGKDLLLFRLSNPTIDGANGMKPAGIWAGMSGSPVYDGDGRLIGAVSYSPGPDNLPIAGVTPAEYMKNLGTTSVSQPQQVRLTDANVKVSAKGAQIAGTPLSGSAMTQVKTVRIAGPAGATQNGFTNRTLARTPGTSSVAKLLRSGEFSAAPKQSTATKPLVAGGNVVAAAASGDLVIGWIGTVTAICGSTVWAFGHPISFSGKTTLLMSNASAAAVIPDGLSGSFKLPSGLFAPAGVINQDRRTGLRGTLGASAGFPLTVDVKNSKGKQLDRYKVTVAHPDAAAPATADMIGLAAIDQLDQSGAGTGTLNWTISYKRANGKAGKLNRSQVVSDRSYFPEEIGTPPADDVWAITQQSHEKVTVTGVTVTLTLQSADAVAYRLSKVQRLSGKKWVSLTGSKLKAGSSHTLRPVFRVLRNDKPTGARAGSTFKVKLPKTARTKGSVSLISVADASSCSPDQDGDPSCDDWSSAVENAKSFDDLVTLLQLQPSNAGIAGVLNYRRAKGSGRLFLTLAGPGVTSGKTSAKFTIKK